MAAIAGRPIVLVLLIAALLVASSVALTSQMMRESQLYRERLHSLRLAQSVANDATISPQCNRSLTALVTSNNTALKTRYADAAGKIGGGILVGNLAWLGSYGECTSIPGASYCLASIGLTIKNQTLPAKWGICVPKECVEKDIAVALEDIINALGLKFIHLAPDVNIGGGVAVDSKTVHCAKPSKYTGGVIATLVLCGVVLFLCLCGTIIEVAQEYVHSAAALLRKNDSFMPVSNESPTEEEFTAQRDVKTKIGSHVSERAAFLVYSERKNVVVEFFLCFSLIRNTNRILDTNIPPNAITSINGMRVLSIFWVILGHTYAFQLAGGIIDNSAIEFTILQRFTFQAIINATVSVDSFFFISGLLAAYLSFRQMERNEARLNLFQFYFHRFWRLTPVYMFVLLFYDKLTGFLGEGPIWYMYQTNEPCDKYWWTNLLYINNFYPTSMGKMCMAWSWYLANDMQFYVICPVILFAANRYGKRGLVLTVSTLMLACFISTAVIIDHYKLGSSLLDQTNGDSQSLVYEKPYCRIAPYLVGVTLGYLFHVNKDSRKTPHLCVFVCGWCVAIVLALTPLYGPYHAYKKNHPVPLTLTENVMYGTFSRCSWALALAWVVYACHVGYGGLVNKILSARFWIPLSRLTYCVYLVHLIVLCVYFGNYQTTSFYSDMNISWHFIAATSVSYVVAFMVSVTFEIPMMQLEKLIFKTDRKKD